MIYSFIGIKILILVIEIHILYLCKLNNFHGKYQSSKSQREHYY